MRISAIREAVTVMGAGLSLRLGGDDPDLRRNILTDQMWDVSAIGGHLASAMFMSVIGGWPTESTAATPAALAARGVDLIGRFEPWRAIAKEADAELSRRGLAFVGDYSGLFGPHLDEFLDGRLFGEPPAADDAAFVGEMARAIQRDIDSEDERRDIAQAIKEGTIDWPPHFTPKKEKKPRKRKIDHSRTPEAAKIKDSMGR